MITESAFPWELDALDFVRAHLPDHDTYYAWTNFEFIADGGYVNEVDAAKMHQTRTLTPQTLSAWTQPFQ